MIYSKITFIYMVLIIGLVACKGKRSREEPDPHTVATTTAQQAAYASFFISELSAFGTPVDRNEWGKPTAKLYNIQACVNDIAGHGRVGRHEFSVSDKLSGGMTLTQQMTDPDGCFRWQETFEFDYFAPEAYVVITRYITGEQKMGRVKISFYIDPWSSDVKYHPFNNIVIPGNQQAVNLASVTNKVSETGFSSKIEPIRNDKSLTSLSEITFIWKGPEYGEFEVDKQLNLKIAHRYLISFTPKILRRAIVKPFEQESPDNTGKVKLTLIILKEDRKNPDLSDFRNYVASFEKTFEVNQQLNTIIEEFVIKFADISHLVTRMKVLAKVEPLVSSPYVMPGYFEGDLNNLGGSPNGVVKIVKQTAYDIDAIHMKFTALLKKQKEELQDPVVLMEKTFGFYHILDQDLAARPLPANGYGVGSSRFCPEGGNLRPLNKTLLQKAFEVGFSNLPECSRRDLVSSFEFEVARRSGLNPLKLNGNVEVIQRQLVKTVDRVPGVDVATNGNPPSSGSFSISYSDATMKGYNNTTSVSATLEASATASMGHSMASTLSLLQASPSVGSGNSAWTPQSSLTPGIGLNIGAGIGARKSWGYTWASTGTVSATDTTTLTLNYQGRNLTIRGEVYDCLVGLIKDFGQDRWETSEVRTKKLKAARVIYYCSAEAKPKSFTEKYYYVTETTGDSTSWTDTNSTSERAFTMFIRGKDRLDLIKSYLKKRVLSLNTLINYDSLSRENGALPPESFERVNQTFPGMLSEP